jgi:hypothetical protein
MYFLVVSLHIIIDGFIKSPTSALRFISLSLRRTLSTRPSGPTLADYTKFARLEFGAFYFAISILIFYKFVIIGIPKKNCQSEMILPIFLPNFFIDLYSLHGIKDSITQLSINKMKIEL